MKTHFHYEADTTVAGAPARNVVRTDAPPTAVVVPFSNTGRKNERENPIASPEILRGGEWIERLATSGFDGRMIPIIIEHPLPDELTAPYAALVDWLSFTVTPPLINALMSRLDGHDDAGYKWMCFELFALLDIKAQDIERQKTGGSGYKYRSKFPGGHILWGGAHQKGTVHVSLSGEGCTRIKDWQIVRAWLEKHQARLTRVDLASDDFSGETYTVDKMRIDYETGKFGTGGRKPSAKLVDDLGSGKGRTLYVGERKNGKLFRCYEKGKQLGDPENAWVRIEVEWHNKARVLPYDMLTRPGQYLSGAYPCLSFLNIEQSKIKTIFRGAKIVFERAMNNARQAYGKLINLAVGVYGGDFGEVVKRLIREDGYPSRIEAYSYHIKQNLEALAQPFGMMPNYAK